jgi:outer membrane murein-binding lipoprotein Lpp
MKKTVPVLVAVVLAGILSGCAAPARIDQMSATVSPSQRVASTALRTNIAVRDVTGGKDTNPMWVSNVGNSEFEQALEASLRDAGLLAAGKQAGKYTLVAHLENVDQPMAGFNMTVTATVSYSLVERATGKEVFSRRVSLPYTASMGAAFSGTERLRIANEGAVRVNITQLIEELLALKIGQVAMN